MSFNSGVLKPIFFLLIVAAALSLGCDIQRQIASRTVGTVTFQGKPVANAAVLFYPRGSTQACSTVTNERGEFIFFELETSQELPTEYKVVIRPNETKLEAEPLTEIDLMSARTDIPLAYQNPATSRLSLLVVEGENEMNIVLEN